MYKSIHMAVKFSQVKKNSQVKNCTTHSSEGLHE